MNSSNLTVRVVQSKSSIFVSIKKQEVPGSNVHVIDTGTPVGTVKEKLTIFLVFIYIVYYKKENWQYKKELWIHFTAVVKYKKSFKSLETCWPDPFLISTHYQCILSIHLPVLSILKYVTKVSSGLEKIEYQYLICMIIDIKPLKENQNIMKSINEASARWFLLIPNCSLPPFRLYFVFTFQFSNMFNLAKELA